uniref:Transcription activator n=1 Tax=Tetraselmis sp. GSL018 TaxID=582737 RepID=A0A061SG71_9CHLO
MVASHFLQTSSPFLRVGWDSSHRNLSMKSGTGRSFVGDRARSPALLKHFRADTRCKGLGDDLKNSFSDLWARSAVDHPFLVAVRKGTIKDEQYNTWLLQDYLFVQTFTRFAGKVLAKAPDEEGMFLILRSLGVLPDELRWFRTTLESRGVPVDLSEEQPVLRRYREALERWGDELDWAEAVLVYYAVEHVYGTAWGTCAAGAPEPYRTWAMRWGSPEFAAFCDDLERAAAKALHYEGGALPEGRRERAEELFREVLELEEEFWSMAFYRDAPQSAA